MKIRGASMFYAAIENRQIARIRIKTTETPRNTATSGPVASRLRSLGTGWEGKNSSHIEAS